MTREEAKKILTCILHTDGAYMDYLDSEDVEAIKFLANDERPHGEWIRHIDDLFPEESTEECSVCHEEQRITGNDDNFCPNCGADMREGDSDA